MFCSIYGYRLCAVWLPIMRAAATDYAQTPPCPAPDYALHRYRSCVRIWDRRRGRGGCRRSPLPIMRAARGRGRGGCQCYRLCVARRTPPLPIMRGRRGERAPEYACCMTGAPTTAYAWGAVSQRPEPQKSAKRRYRLCVAVLPTALPIMRGSRKLSATVYASEAIATPRAIRAGYAMHLGWVLMSDSCPHPKGKPGGGGCRSVR